ncbi:MAG: acyl carrier protein [Candidatus Brocadia sp.]|nr:acyl carrier protein [Candidatus Brocadia sp.]
MANTKNVNCFDRDTILRDLINIIAETSYDWENGFSGTVGKETRLIADLALTSIQIVQLVIAIEKHFQRQGLPFQKLFMSDTRDVGDLRVLDLAEFLYTHLNAP